MIEELVFRVLEEREVHSGKEQSQSSTIHIACRLGFGKPIMRWTEPWNVATERDLSRRNNDERLEYLFKLYENMVEAKKKTETMKA